MKTTGERPRLVALFSDFGWQGPYLGQMTAVLAAAGVQAPVVNLMADAPLFDPRASAYLLAPLSSDLGLYPDLMPCRLSSDIWKKTA